MKIAGLATLIMCCCLGFGACGGAENSDCAPRSGLYCHEGVNYWVDSCGEISEISGTCPCGCLPDHSDCQDCEVCPGLDCPCGCADNGLECKECHCNPDCGGRECGPDGCGGTCAPGCSEGKACDEQGQCRCPEGQALCRNVCCDLQTDLQNCGSCGNQCNPDDECQDGVCEDPIRDIGDACASHEQCGEQGYCLSDSQGFYQGYCLTLNCTDDQPCSLGNDCYTLFSDGTTACIRHCRDNSDCRFDDGYICDQEYQICWPGCLADHDCPMWHRCNLETKECEEKPTCSTGECPEGELCSDGHCVIDVGSGPGQNLFLPLDQLESHCPDLPELECTGGEAHCGELVPFDPDYGPGYIDYPENGETWDNQYRSFIRRDTMMMIKYACAYVDCLAADWVVGNGQPLGLIDMSEANGAIPGTSIGQPGHPQGTHTNGNDIDVSYYQVGTGDNRARPICEHHQNGEEAYHCTATPHLLDPWRTALFLGALIKHPHLRVVGADGKAGPILISALRLLCENGWLPDSSCGRSHMLAYEETNQGYGWFHFHHHHMHVSFNRDPYKSRSAPQAKAETCLIPGCADQALWEFLDKFGLR